MTACFSNSMKITAAGNIRSYRTFHQNQSLGILLYIGPTEFCAGILSLVTDKHDRIAIFIFQLFSAASAAGMVILFFVTYP